HRALADAAAVADAHPAAFGADHGRRQDLHMPPDRHPGADIDEGMDGAAGAMDGAVGDKGFRMDHRRFAFAQSAGSRLKLQTRPSESDSHERSVPLRSPSSVP